MRVGRRYSHARKTEEVHSKAEDKAVQGEEGDVFRKPAHSGTAAARWVAPRNVCSSDVRFYGMYLYAFCIRYIRT